MDPLQALRDALEAVKTQPDAHTARQLGELAAAAGIEVATKSNGVPKGSKADLIATLAGKIEELEAPVVLDAPEVVEEAIAEVIVMPGVQLEPHQSLPAIPPPPGGDVPDVHVRGSVNRRPGTGNVRGSGGKQVNPLAGLAHPATGTAHFVPGESINSLSSHVMVGAGGQAQSGVPVVQGSGGSAVPAVPPPPGAGGQGQGSVTVTTPQPGDAGPAAPAAAAAAAAPRHTRFAPSSGDQVVGFVAAAGRNLAAATAVAEGHAPHLLESLAALGEQLAASLAQLEKAVTAPPAASTPSPPARPAPPAPE